MRDVINLEHLILQTTDSTDELKKLIAILENRERCEGFEQRT